MGNSRNILHTNCLFWGSNLITKTHNRNKYWLLLICGLLFSAAGCANQANNTHQSADSSEPAGGIGNLPGRIIMDSKSGLEELSEASGYMLEAATADVNNWPQRIIRDSKESFLRPDNLAIILLAGGASVALHSSGADKNIADHFEDHHDFHGFADESLNVIGHPWTQLGAAALWYGFSKKDNDEFNVERAKAMIAALSVTGVATMGAKAIRDNDSPNGKNWAWPSGHAASSFTIASMLDEFYGPRAGIPAYALASVISYRMLDTGDHWTSDIVFGAAVGWVVGHTFADRHKQLEVAGFKVLPYTAHLQINDSTVVGVNFVKKF